VSEKSAVPQGYREAVERAALVDRNDRGRLLLHGRAPAQMLAGIVTNRLPDAPEPEDEGSRVRGRARYAAILTPKGKMVTELRLIRLEGEVEAFLLDLPAAGLEGTMAYFGKYLPPRFATVDDLAGETGMLTVVGPAAAETLVGEGLASDSATLEQMEEDAFVAYPDRDRPHTDSIRVLRAWAGAVPAFDVLGRRSAIVELRGRLEGAGLPVLGEEVERVLRIESGRPVFGEELDESTIPLEAGLEERAIDHGKGCYTGQEVIIRIRDRGKVNRHLRGLLLGDVAPPEPGTELYIDGRSRGAGEVRSAVRSPRFGQTVGLGYVRRELEIPGRARLGFPDGPEVDVREVTDGGWVLAEGDPGA